MSDSVNVREYGRWAHHELHGCAGLTRKPQDAVPHSQTASCYPQPAQVPSQPSPASPARSLYAQVYGAARAGDEARLRELLASVPSDPSSSPVDALNEDGFTALHAAAAFGHAPCVRLLLDHGADVNIHGMARAKSPCTAISLQSALFHPVKRPPASPHDDETERRGPDQRCPRIHVSQEDRRTALHHAACFGRAEIIELLLSVESVDVEARDSRGCTPLHLASAADEGACIALLLAAGADVEAKAGVRRGSGKALPLCLRSRPFHHQSSPAFTRARVYPRNSQTQASRCTALHLACGSGATDTIRTLLEAGADLLEADDNGCTALHVAALCGHPRTVRELIEAARAEGRVGDFVGMMDTEARSLCLLRVCFSVAFHFSFPGVVTAHSPSLSLRSEMAAPTVPCSAAGHAHGPPQGEPQPARLRGVARAPP